MVRRSFFSCVEEHNHVQYKSDYDSTHLVRNFNRITRALTETPNALLITQKRGVHLVLVNADIYEDLLNKQLELTHMEFLKNGTNSNREGLI